MFSIYVQSNDPRIRVHQVLTPLTAVITVITWSIFLVSPHPGVSKSIAYVASAATVATVGQIIMRAKALRMLGQRLDPDTDKYLYELALATLVLSLLTAIGVLVVTVADITHLT